MRVGTNNSKICSIRLIQQKKRNKSSLESIGARSVASFTVCFIVVESAHAVEEYISVKGRSERRGEPFRALQFYGALWSEITVAKIESRELESEERESREEFNRY
ncbi:hypothetical protein J6590_084276 [Homalodisca vitripennis]|nr:hypothetical protein J6590_084276 [Homalodisca vitripennis]